MRNKLHTFKKRSAIVRKRHIRRFRIFSKHPVAVPVFTFLALSLITIGIGLFVHLRSDGKIVDARVVIISQERGKQQVVPSRESTVGQLLSRLDIKLNQGDVVEPALSTRIDQDQFRINIYRARPVEIIDNGARTFAQSAATTSRSIANQSGVTTYAEDDIVARPVDNFVEQKAIGQQISIKRATPINVNLYGTAITTRTQAKTVGDMLKEKKIILAKDDQVTPAADQPIAPGQQIFIVRNGTTLTTETQVIDAPVQTINDPNLAYGTTAVRQQGSPGQQVVTYQVITANGKETGRTVIQAVVTTQPVTKIVAQGTNLAGSKGDMARAGIAPSDYTYVDYIITKESHWNPSARNASSGAYGLCQALPGSKMASAGSDWATNPVTQLKWCDGYAKGRYGSWANAYRYWLNNHYW
ncbi:MAG: hypothetical protein JWM37_530 [Candidatus Saccharibacteria bacterium]|nr:hypothetical protein [Candidatus Saccharibacteria bacterium]